MHLIDASNPTNRLYVSQEVFECMQRIPPIDPESKPLEAFLHPIDSYKGLKAKYLVFKADTGERVDNCFILRPDKDPAAVAALRAYAAATDNGVLAEDIYNWVGKGESLRPQGHWIGEADGYADGELVYDVWYSPSVITVLMMVQITPICCPITAPTAVLR